MAKLSYAKRKSLPDSDFAVIQKKRVKNKTTGKTTTKKIRRFPINDAAHARNALSRMPQADGLTSNEKGKIMKKAKKKLGHETESMRKHKKKSDFGGKKGDESKSKSDYKKSFKDTDKGYKSKKFGEAHGDESRSKRDYEGHHGKIAHHHRELAKHHEAMSKERKHEKSKSHESKKVDSHTKRMRDLKSDKRNRG